MIMLDCLSHPTHIVEAAYALSEHIADVEYISYAKNTPQLV